ncbi:MAG: SPOR domain-containing protein [Ignavibacteriaceae bacterium]|nr:SPOR domain-containing protein [Ignavibacteriaceae bacterium]
MRFLTIFFTFSILFLGCSASTDTRYGNRQQDKVEVSSEQKVAVEDEFDLTPYRTKFEIPFDSSENTVNELDVWYDYEKIEPANEFQKTIVDSIPGFRVQVVSTDNLEEANGIRSEVYFKTNEKAIYIFFEPPFYVVRVGDFKNINDAKATSFKLNQLGFSGTKVVNDIINIYK